MSSSTSKKKVNVELHYPHVVKHNYVNVVGTTLSGSQNDILRIEMPTRVVCYRLENVLMYEIIGE
jgi:hypothetical protein